MHYLFTATPITSGGVCKHRSLLFEIHQRQYNVLHFIYVRYAIFKGTIKHIQSTHSRLSDFKEPISQRTNGSKTVQIRRISPCLLINETVVVCYPIIIHPRKVIVKHAVYNTYMISSVITTHVSWYIPYFHVTCTLLTAWRVVKANRNYLFVVDVWH